ncbi:MAG: YlxM family DNA-binding protein [Erysipelotrichaceae bacterium]
MKADRMNRLLDFYQSLLTKHQFDVASLYYYEDLSLAEIAEHTNTSRAAIHETIKRVELIMEEYEAKLSLVQKYDIRKALYRQLEAINDQRLNEILNKLHESE